MKIGILTPLASWNNQNILAKFYILLNSLLVPLSFACKRQKKSCFYDLVSYSVV